MMSQNNGHKPGNAPVINIERVSKHYQQGNETVRAVDNVTLQVFPEKPPCSAWWAG
jgi:ABC-type glutathione transport system ATPase component